MRWFHRGKKASAWRTRSSSRCRVPAPSGSAPPRSGPSFGNSSRWSWAADSWWEESSPASSAWPKPWSRSKAWGAGQALLDAPEVFGESLQRLADGYVLGGVSVGALLLAWALQDWLRSPTVQEARLAGALVQAGTRAAPEEPTEVAGRLASVLAPDRGLERPVVAAAIWVLAVTLGWAAVVATSDFRRVRSSPPPLSIWPDPTHPVELAADLKLAKGRGGQPIINSLSTLSITPGWVRLGPVVLAESWSQNPQEDWRKGAASRLSETDDSTGSSVLVAAHESMPARTVLEVLGFLSQSSQINTFELLFEHPLGARQAILRAFVGAPPSPVRRVRIGPNGRAFRPGDEAPLAVDSIRKELRDDLRQGRTPAVEVLPTAETSWRQVVAFFGRAR